MNFLMQGIISFAFFATFPFSLLFSVNVFGIQTTKQLLSMLLEEFLQTLAIMICAIAAVIGFIYFYVWPWVVGLFG